MSANDPVVHVIDDDDAARESLTFLLATAQLPVRAYESARAFLDIAPPAQLGCVITDVRMPEIDGIETSTPTQGPQYWLACHCDYRSCGCSTCRRGHETGGGRLH
jgi:FixJ family two-component response regulator